ncbi:MAG: leucine-rich repeat domain-containing protein, partial [Candidatus Hodarchaeota archaeon]
MPTRKKSTKKKKGKKQVKKKKPIKPLKKRNGIVIYQNRAMKIEENKVLGDFEKLLGRKIPAGVSIKKIDGYNIRTRFIAKNGHITGLGIWAIRLTTLPKSLGNLKSLKRLWLKNCDFKNLPESIGNLESLQELDLYYDKLTTLPESFGKLKSLQNLNLKENKLTMLPKSFENLKSLKKLDLEKNRL